MFSEISAINYWAVLIASLSIFALGGLWYSPKVFGGIWQREAQLLSKETHPAKVFITSFVFALIAAFAFALLVGPHPGLNTALLKGAIVGILVATSFGINYQFGNRGIKLLLIDGGYHFIQFLIYGLVFGLASS